MPDPTEDEELTLELPLLSARTRAMNPSSHDVVLQARIWEQIRATRELDATQVSVVVRNRSATLFGTVADEAQRAQMAGIAARISGVLEVTNRLKVEPPAR
ncbi:MAG TPA: BON domain-containing protein [Polyangiaceae bacterium]|jgi:osmotically-inducible protein OsmY|nr:BON domain-containing protein [Polyangiaceae bacterium]